MILNFLSVWLIIKRYNLRVEIKKVRMGSIAEHDNIWNQGLIKPLIAEILINLVFLPPWLDGMYKIQGSIYVKYDYSNIINSTNINSVISNYTYNYTDTELEAREIDYNQKVLVSLFYDSSNLLTMFILLRCYHVVRLVYTFSHWSTTQADKICKLMNSEASISFSLKAYLKVSPFAFLVNFILILIVIFGIGIRVFEYYNDTMMQMLDSEYSDGDIEDGYM